ncbi:hypothetical protein [Rhabdothermincola salaria]|uniref:hypothetical protein n=1 Tax=Rhabdothermincola salaria TaxID=2903142 RepID=UPI001E4A0739|nr:hypothetical protein [Rhabdothermincola salaria]MCD9625718.1 hypothetical protein [Rhabdothermincola salaria]
MRLTRVVIEADGRRFHLDMHPGLTVVSGLDRVARRSLGRAIVSTLGTGRPGLHAEVLTDDGHHLAVFRPPSSPVRVVDVDSARDITGDVAPDGGPPDLLAHFGVGPTEAPAVVLMGPRDLETRSVVEQRILELAHVDQHRLWDVADKVAERAAQLSQLGGEPEELDSVLVEEIDRRHRAFEAAQAEHERAQRVWLLFGANAGLMAAPVAVAAGWAAAIPFLGAAAAMTAWSAHEWRVVEAARREESAALEEAGATSYLAFQLARVDRALGTEAHRRRLGQLVGAHRAALQEWRLLAGDTDVEWADQHRREILGTAQRLRDAARAGAPSPAVMPGDETARDRLDRLRVRLAVRPSGGESVPLVCDDPFIEVDPGAKPPLLEALVECARQRQVILLTDDAEVTTWARVERLTGDVELVEHAPVR